MEAELEAEDDWGLRDHFPVMAKAMGYGGGLSPRKQPSFESWSEGASDQHDILGSFTDDEPDDESDDGDWDAPGPRILAPSKFGRPREDLGWQPEEAAVRDAILARVDREVRRVLAGDDLLFLRLVRGFRLLEDRVGGTAAICEWVASRRAAWRADALLRTRLEPADFHRRVWPTWVSGRDAFGHLVVLEKLGSIDFDRLLLMPLDEVLRLRVQALDCLQRELARPLAGYGRVYKCVFLVDVAGASLSHLWKGETMALAKAYAKLTENMYADAVWKNVVVNAPGLARGAWRVIERLLDDETKDLISFVQAAAGAPDTPAKLDHAGVPRAAAPAYLGGDAHALLVADLLDDDNDDDDDEARGAARDAIFAPAPRADLANLRRFSSHDDDDRSKPPGFDDDGEDEYDDDIGATRAKGDAAGFLSVKVVLLLFLVFDCLVFYFRSRRLERGASPDL